jgi:type 1 glutamine amidotransferase
MTRAAAIFMLSLGLYGRPSAWAQPTPQGQNPNGMKIYLWTGLKSHGAGQHDYPQFLADWSKLLTERGAVVSGSLHAPSAADLGRSDVVVIYKGDAGYLTPDEKAALDAYVKRGGGLVSFHDALCGPDPAYFASLIGGAKKHGEVNYTLDAPIRYTIVDKSNPILQDLSDVTLFDEAFYNMTWAKDPGINVLASAAMPPTRSAGEHKGEVVPQIWTYEHTVPGGQPLRLDARPHLHQLRQLPDSANSAARHRLGRQEARQ